MISKKEIEFLRESNAIEREYSDEALEDAKLAWTMACVTLKHDEKYLDGKIDMDLILGIHRRLMKRLNPRIAGKIRDCAVYIGGEKKDQSKKEIIIQLKELVELWKKNKDLLKYKRKQDKELFIKRWHILFEFVHFACDGNGRTGRILMNLQRLYLGLPILIIHEGDEQQEYYKWFK